MVRGLETVGRGLLTTGDAVESGTPSLPDTRNWVTPSVAVDNSRDGDAGNTVDNNTSTYSVLDSSGGGSGTIEWSVSSEYKAVRFDFNDTTGQVEVRLGDGTVIKTNWDVSGSPYYIVDFDAETGGSIKTTTLNYVIENVDGGTNKRVAETDADTDV